MSDDSKGRPSGAISASTSAPRFPFQDWPVQLCSQFGFIWYTEPGVFVSQLTVERGTLEDAKAMTECVDRVLCIKRADFEPHGGLLLLHDWKLLKSYDSAARNHLFVHARGRKKGDVRAAVVSLTLTPVLRMAVEAGNALLTATTGRNIDIVPGISTALGKHRVMRPTDPHALSGLGLELWRPPTTA